MGRSLSAAPTQPISLQVYGLAIVLVRFYVVLSLGLIPISQVHGVRS